MEIPTKKTAVYLGQTLAQARVRDRLWEARHESPALASGVEVQRSLTSRVWPSWSPDVHGVVSSNRGDERVSTETSR